MAGKSVVLRGGAYRVRGLAVLKPLPSARIRARYTSELHPETKWQEVKADATGFFKIEVPLPAEHSGAASLAVAVGDGQSERLFFFPVDFVQPWRLDLHTDRRLYEPGEVIHVWTRLRNALSKRPLANHKVQLRGLPGMESEGVTGASGVISAKFVIPKHAKAGSYEIVAKVNDKDWNTVRFQIGRRNRNEFMATVQVSPESVGPHEEVECTVKVMTASGAVVRDAQVELDIDGTRTSGATDAQGIATFKRRAPAYMEHATGQVAISANVKHPGFGTTSARTILGLMVPLSLRVYATASTGALTPEVPGQLYIQVSSGDGKPVSAGTSVVVQGAAIPGGRAMAKSDRHGIATVPALLPLGASAGADLGMTRIRVEVRAEVTSVTSLAVLVTPGVEVVPRLERVVVAPGDWIDIRMHRRKRARKVPVIVELLADSELIDTRKVAPGVNRVRMQAPSNRLGILHVRTRALHERGVVEGVGGMSALLVRPSRPSFPSLQTGKKVYGMKSIAKLRLRTDSKAGRSWASVLVRDLAAHSGELPFAYYFLKKTLEQAILHPDTPSSQTFLRVALADYVAEDSVPAYAPNLLDDLGEEPEEPGEYYQVESRELMRDPFPMAQELARRGVGGMMLEVEALLGSALEDGRLSELMLRRRNRSQFRPEVLSRLEEAPLSLGDQELSLAMLLAADSSFTYDNVAKRLARHRLVHLLVALAAYLDPGDEATLLQRAAAREPSTRWLARMVEVGLIDAQLLADPWGQRFVLRPAKSPRIVVAVEAAHWELVSPGPDGVLGNADDISDPFQRAVPAGTSYAVRSGEDELMAALSRLAPGAKVLERLLAAYQRVGVQLTEEKIGDAVRASISKGWGGGGGVGYGTVGQGSGMGYGSGHGGMRGRRAKVPNLIVGRATTGYQGAGRFARVLREKFPATLLFVPTLQVDPSGITEIPIPLADAATTYLVEVVVWSEDGWTWSANHKIRVDREAVIDAPVPTIATVGDRLELPIRVGNRSERSQNFVLSVDGFGMQHESALQVPAKDNTHQSLTMHLVEPSRGRVVVGLVSEQGKALDAIARPMQVRVAARRVRLQSDRLVSRPNEQLILEVPLGAEPRIGSTVRVRSGLGLFPQKEHAQLVAAWLGGASSAPSLLEGLNYGQGDEVVEALAAAWGNAKVPVDKLKTAMFEVAEMLSRLEDMPLEKQLLAQASLLLRLAPAVHTLKARPALATKMEALVRQLRKKVQAKAAQADSPKAWALSAAALTWSAPPSHKNAQAQELLRRVRRHQLWVGEHTWVASTEGAQETSALTALAHVKLGNSTQALALLRTLAHLVAAGRLPDPWTRALAQVALQHAGASDGASSVVLNVDGEQVEVPLKSGSGQLALLALGTAGTHTVALAHSRNKQLYYLEVLGEYGLPWTRLPAKPGPLAVTLRGEVGTLGQEAKFELIVQNRSPQAIAKPMIEISLPAGAQLPSLAAQGLARLTQGAPSLSDGTLEFTLASLLPGQTRKIPLKLRWTVGGHLQGLGVASFPGHAPHRLNILAPRVVHIRGVEVSP